MNEYKGYTLDYDIWTLDEHEKEILDEGVLLVDNHWSIRQLAENICKSKSQVHRDLHRIKSLSYDLYGCIRRILKQNEM